MAAIKHILIVGGGTAGWLTASILAATHSQTDAQGRKLCITLIESQSVAPIGVGEGTWPTMRQTLATIGISESQLLKHASATFKQASKFVNWHSSTENSHYYHPFSAPQGSARLDISPYWALQQNTQGYAEDVCFQPHICEQGLAPKAALQPTNLNANYGYHFDASQFVTLLQQHGTETLGIKHIYDHVESVTLDDNGIKNLITSKNGALSADLFVDCSGFSGRLIEQALQVPLQDCSDVLLADSALVTQQPYPSANAAIKSYTQATAQAAGWVWDIGLQNRRGVGYVYSSQFCQQETAHRTLESYLNSNTIEARCIKFKTGYRQQFWKQNCVAIGLSSGFLEPLEASALMLIEQSALLLAKQLPSNSDVMPAVAARFNQKMTYKWQRTIEFLKLHYVLSERQEPFWQANKAPSSVPQRLQELLQEWKYRLPADEDFEVQQEVFSAQSYRYVLLGMAAKVDLSQEQRRLHQHALANKQFSLNNILVQQFATQVPSHRGLIENILNSI